MDRRYFLQASAAAGSAALLAGGQLLGDDKKTSQKLRVGMIGTGGMGDGNHGGVKAAGAEIVALCDVDDKTNEKAAAKSPKAKKFRDFRKMLEECGKELDAVVVSTPDNCHTVAAVMAMKMGLHCYCEKPLTHDIYEARLMAQVAATTKAKGGGPLKTQMGNRGTAEPGFRRGVELLQAGVIGPVTEIHVWCNRPIWPQGMKERPAPKTPPANLDWDLWLGPAQERPFGDGYHPFAWRGYWDFGTGALGDMACHTCNQAYMGLKLGSVQAVTCQTKAESNESPPLASTIVYEFAARGEGFPACKLFWYDGIKDNNPPTPELVEKIKVFTGTGKVPTSGVIYVGSKGMMFAPDDYATQYKLSTPELTEAAKKVPETLPRAKGSHYAEWVQACTDAIPKAMSNFPDHAGPMTEFVLLGNVAMRVGKRIEWDGRALKATNCPEAAQYVRREYRKGWALDASPT